MNKTIGHDDGGAVGEYLANDAPRARRTLTSRARHTHAYQEGVVGCGGAASGQAQRANIWAVRAEPDASDVQP